MKPIKMTCLALALMMTVGFAACGNDKDANTQENAANSSGPQPGAKVEKRINENGHREIEYQNPDGSAGGEVEIEE